MFIIFCWAGRVDGRQGGGRPLGWRGGRGEKESGRVEGREKEKEGERKEQGRKENRKRKRKENPRDPGKKEKVEKGKEEKRSAPKKKRKKGKTRNPQPMHRWDLGPTEGVWVSTGGEARKERKDDDRIGRGHAQTRPGRARPQDANTAVLIDHTHSDRHPQTVESSVRICPFLF